jgi:hypothetical protein
MYNLQTPSRGWVKQKAKLKSIFPNLVDADFVYEYGQKEAMMNHLQSKIGTTRSGLVELITDKKTMKKFYK